MVSLQGDLIGEVTELMQKLTDFKIEILDYYRDDEPPLKVVPIEKTIKIIKEINDSERFPRNPDKLETALKNMCIYLVSKEYIPDYDLVIIYQLDKIKTRSSNSIKIKNSILYWYSTRKTNNKVT